MNCCIKCFRDDYIRTTIDKQGSVGDCDFCGAKGVAVYNVGDPSNPISEKIIELVQTYSVSDHAEAKPLKFALRDDWDIFTAGAETILTLTKKLCATVYTDDAEIFKKNVIIEQLMDEDFLRKFGVVCGYSWDDFSKAIKYGNRFHSGMFNSEEFASFLSIIKSIYPAGTHMYRARISTEKTGFTKNEMGAPPIGKRIAGRINPDGIGVLYLSLDKKTVLNEVRASAFDYVTIGKFQATRDINVANLSDVGKTSPFLHDIDLEKFAANRKVFQEIAAEIAKPLRRSDSPLEYLPTQYIAEFIKSENCDGVKYASTFRQGGYNFAAFNENLFDCVDVETVEVSEILYNTDPKLSD